MTDIALIVGGGAGMWEQWRTAVDMVAASGARAVYCAVNGAGVDHPDPLHHWVSQHPDNLHHSQWDWARKRRENGHVGGYTVWGTREGDAVDRWIHNWERGSSGMLALDAMLNGVGVDGAILCGIGIDTRPNPYNSKSRDGWKAAQRFWGAWEKHAPKFAKRTRSMSGNTRSLLGSPTLEWVRGLGEARDA